MKKRADWQVVLVEMTTGPMVAILFWITVLLIVVMTFAHGKFFEANFFEIFGAVGQVGFAGAVFWLGWQQFEFTKRAAIRQARIDSYEPKRALFLQFERLRKGIYVDRSAVHLVELASLAEDISHLFGEAAVEAVVNAVEVYEEAAMRFMNQSQLLISAAPNEEIAKSRKVLDNAFDATIEALEAGLQAMSLDMIIGGEPV